MNKVQFPISEQWAAISPMGILKVLPVATRVEWEMAFFPYKNFQGFAKDFISKWAFNIQILEHSEKPHLYKLIKMNYLNLYFCVVICCKTT